MQSGGNILGGGPPVLACSGRGIPRSQPRFGTSLMIITAFGARYRTLQSARLTTAVCRRQMVLEGLSTMHQVQRCMVAYSVRRIGLCPWPRRMILALVLPAHCACAFFRLLSRSLLRRPRSL